MFDTGEKPFYCEICGNHCAHKGSLKTLIKHDNNYVKKLTQVKNRFTVKFVGTIVHIKAASEHI